MPRNLIIAIACAGVGSFGLLGSGLSGAALRPNDAKKGEAVASGQWNGLSAADLRPGESRTRHTTITNTSSREALFAVTEKNAVNPLGADLQLLIAEAATGRAVYSGALGGAGTVELGPLAAGAQRSYRFTVTLAAAATNAAQGRTASAEYRWDGYRR